MQVLAKFYGGSPAKAQRRKTRKPVVSPDYLMQCCRIVLRHVADADKGEVFSILIGGPEGHGTGKVRGMVARPLDFRTIDARLAAGAYGGLPEAFAADVRQVWLLSNGNLCSVMGLLCFFFFHFYRKLLPTNLSTFLNWRVPHISSIADMEECGRSSWEWQ